MQTGKSLRRREFVSKRKKIVLTHCIECEKERKKKDYEENKTIHNERSKLYQIANKKELLAYAKNYRDTNRAIIREKEKQYRQTPEGKAYAIKKDAARRLRVKNTRVGKVSAKQIIAAREAFNNTCAYCHGTDDITLDHFYPLITNGWHGADNLIPACRSCNSRKGGKQPFQWYSQHENFTFERLNKIVEFLIQVNANL